MKKITHEFKEELIVQYISDLANDRSTQQDCARYGFKGILEMTDDEIVAFASTYQMTPQYENV